MWLCVCIDGTRMVAQTLIRLSTLVRVPDEHEWNVMTPHEARSRRTHLVAKFLAGTALDDSYGSNFVGSY
jgi:hypothetical protein